MIGAVDKVGLNVADQDRAKQFWTETMGFECVADTPMGDESGEGAGSRWIEVRPPDGEPNLILFTPQFDESKVGLLSGVLFTCDDIQKTHAELTARGVEFPDPPSQQFWGWWATFADPAGNVYGLGQREGSAR